MKPPYVQIVEKAPLPRMALVRQVFPAPKITDVPAAVRAAVDSCEGAKRIRPGMSVALTVGSRGIDKLREMTREIVASLKERGAVPFIVPAMGSHGGATAEGQEQILRGLGITAEFVGCPIRSSMETGFVGKLDNGMEVFIDKHASEADGIVIFNRIKPHNSFRWANESGLVKMLAVGLGKQSGAESCHALGYGRMGRLITEMADMKLKKCAILFGLGIVENAYDELMEIEGYDPETLIVREQEALIRAFRSMPRLPLGPEDAPTASGKLDVLIVDMVGKEFSGSGMDPNVMGRFSTPHASGGPDVTRIVVLDVSCKSHGNAAGVGCADMTTERLFQKYDRNAVYTNGLTSGNPAPGFIPYVMPDDRTAIQGAIKTCHAPDMNALRMMRIPNTLHLGHVMVSEAMLGEVLERSNTELVRPPEPMKFDAGGTIEPIPAYRGHE